MDGGELVSAPRVDTPPRAERDRLRVVLAARHGRRCFYCRRPFVKLDHRATLDHYVPYRLWRGWSETNLVLACGPCNTVKGDRLPLVLVWLLTRAPAVSRTDLGMAA